MANIAAVVTEITHAGERGWRFTWIGLTLNDVGVLDLSPLRFVGNFGGADRSVQVEDGGGTGFNSSNILIQGSNDGGSNFQTLNDPFGTPLSLTVAGVHQIAELTELIQILAGAAIGDVDVNLFMKKVGR